MTSQICSKQRGDTAPHIVCAPPLDRFVGVLALLALVSWSIAWLGPVSLDIRGASLQGYQLAWVCLTSIVTSKGMVLVLMHPLYASALLPYAALSLLRGRFPSKLILAVQLLAFASPVVLRWLAHSTVETWGLWAWACSHVCLAAAGWRRAVQPKM